MDASCNETTETNQMVRSVKEVENVIRLAKLDPGDLMPVSQVVQFSDQLVDQESIRIVEVPAVLATELAVGQTLIIRGDTDDSAVLCSKNHTYDIKEAETSNSLLLIDQLKYPEQCSDINKKEEAQQDGISEALNSDRCLGDSQIKGFFHRYLELIECNEGSRGSTAEKRRTQLLAVRHVPTSTSCEHLLKLASDKKLVANTPDGAEYIANYTYLI